jgi:hypothetical protein
MRRVLRIRDLVGASWNQTGGLILISLSAGVVTSDDHPYLLLCGVERSHTSVKDAVTERYER